MSSSSPPLLLSTLQSPRSCLKKLPPLTSLSSSSAPPFVASHGRVHFPPHQILCTTYLTHSKKTYDRRPMPILPNTCALPARGSGRTYYGEQALSITQLDPTRHSPPKPLEKHFFSSSESEDSDAFALCNSMDEEGYLSDIATVMDGMLLDFLPHPPARDRSRSRSRSSSRSRSRSRSSERETRCSKGSQRHDTTRRKRRKKELPDLEEEDRGRWKSDGVFTLVKDEIELSCLGGF